MRMSLLSITILCNLVLLAEPGNAQHMDKVKVDVQFKGIGLKQALHILEVETPFHFTYRDADLNNTAPVFFEAKQVTVAQVLKVIFGNQPLVFYQQDANIIIKKQFEDKSDQLALPVGLPPLSEVVRGKVTNEKGEPLEGVTITEKGTLNSTITNTQGQFTIIVASGAAVLSMSYIGHQPQEVHVNGQAVLNIVMQSLANDLADVVVVAYGQRQKKIETLGAQANLNVTELKQPVANITTVLAGRVSGLVGVQRTGEPGRDNADLWIRGIATMSNSTPLVLVDGVERSFNNIDPNDVESFTILKDASSTSVFGVKGANGVILITTKKGRAGRTDISLDFYAGLTNFTRLPKTADGVTYLQMANEASMTRGGNPVYSDDIIHKTYTQEDPYLYPNVNWFNEIFNDFGKNRKGNLSIRGGNEKTNFYVSAAYYDETGLFKADGLQKYNTSIKFTRYNFSSALSIKAAKNTTVDLGIKGWISNGNYPGVTDDGSTATDDIFYMALKTYPTLYPKMYPDNREPFLSTGGGLNSAYALLTNHGYMTLFQNQIMSDLQVKQDLGFITKGLSGRFLYSFDATANNTLKRTKSPSAYYATGRDANGNLVYTVTSQGQDYLSFSRSNGGARQFYLEGAISYANTFGKHKVSGMVLYNQSDRVDATAGDLIGSIPYRSLGSVGRFTYAFDERYLAEATFGYNGAETFVPGKRFGFFPSFAAGWVISNEKFYHFDNVFQLLKLRASYGVVGNSKIDINGSNRRFAYVGTVASTNGYSYGQDRGNSIGGVDISDYPVDVTWETETDDMFMINLIQCEAYRITGDTVFINRAAREMIEYLKRLQQPNGLFYHAPDVPFFWGRGNGWMAAGMTEILLSLPANSVYRAAILKGYKAMMQSLLRFQMPDGMWRQLIDDGSAWPETSCTGMFTYAMITGVKNGWLNKKRYGSAAYKAWQTLVTYIDTDGDLREICEGTNKENSRQYYLDRKRITGDMHGQAPLLWCAAAFLSE